MAISLLSHEVSDLCLGKPALRSLSISATISDALSVLKFTGENYISIWSCDHSDLLKIGNSCGEEEKCRCIGKICMVNIVCYLCKEENVSNPCLALKSPVSVLLPEGVSPGVIRHVEPHSSLLEVIDLIIEGGAQNLIVPLKTSSRKKLLSKSSFGPTHHSGHEFCWLTQEDVIRYLLNLIGLFSPTPFYSIESLDIIDPEILAVGYHDPASSAVTAISNALAQQTSVAVVDELGKLLGEISPLTLSNSEETVAAAITTLSAGELMSYIDCGGPPSHLIKKVKTRLEERNLQGMLDLIQELSMSKSSSSSSQPFSSFWSSSSSSSSSSDDECASTLLRSSSDNTPTKSNSMSSRCSRSSCYSARLVRRSEAIVCNRRSSLVAVMIQALAHRVNYVWVIEDDYTLVGIVTFSEMLKIFREHLNSI
ncbi:hypothetical protein C5167_039433 [Papaver somniferum]|uniref:CBS domain-containing protein n=1 Tax=Papaver somniferum TaxID=3469 RepID=A0A4Y7IGC0_PAPSO|nr:CBS domain-containing protein CBSX5-like [Papaver somniferum]RZC46485.1 hypothetical protein C5167_039433 [Papaver somniferum]